VVDKTLYRYSKCIFSRTLPCTLLPYTIILKYFAHATISELWKRTGRPPRTWNLFFLILMIRKRSSLHAINSKLRFKLTCLMSSFFPGLFEVLVVAVRNIETINRAAYFGRSRETTWDADSRLRQSTTIEYRSSVDDPRSFLEDHTLHTHSLSRMSPDEKKVRPVARAAPTAKVDQMVNDDSAKGSLDATQRDASTSSMTAKIEYVPRIKWLDLSVQIFIHAGCLYGLYLVLTQAKWLTMLWGKASFSVSASAPGRIDQHHARSRSRLCAAWNVEISC